MKKGQIERGYDQRPLIYLAISPLKLPIGEVPQLVL